LIGADDRT